MPRIKNFINIKKRWNATGGYSEFLKISIHLVISTGAWAFQAFVDKIFLSWYSNEAYAASLPSELLNSSITEIFLGTVAYIDVFISQYNGKKEYKSIGPAVWQSVYIAFFSSLIILIFAFFSKDIFYFIGHSQDILADEIKYFEVLCYGAFPYLASTAMSGFYAGRGETKIILLANIAGIIVNIIFDYFLIFGNFGFPKLGIEGAAIESNLGSIIVFILFLFLLISKKNHTLYNTRKLSLDVTLIKRMIKFGFPNGVHMFLDLSIFTFFVLIIGTLGKFALSATNVVMNIYSLTYMPLVGFGMTVSILAGNYLGKNKASIVQVSVKSATQITCLYILLMVLAFLFIPDILIYPFSKGSGALIIEQIKPTIMVLLRLIAIFAFFESASIVFSSAIKGAGDTSFVMKLLLALFILAAIPMYLTVALFKMGLYTCWSILIIYGTVPTV
ncbi:MAG: MATE family efflux transporter, partial [Endomicrobium sp.]|nr:MATE family efflux transporter [Endomicrobium sp.]